ncbi:MAG: IS1182 family transposase [Desulfobacterales bacterium]|nr:MAG: IS1182 family transposase [Desulfobacterales bacterium]
MSLLSKSIEEYVAEDDPVRAYDAFIEALDFSQLGIEIDPNKVGNSPYDPKAMLKLLVYGYSYGVRSSRKLERATYHNLSFIWLMGGLQPDHKTIAEYRRNNKRAIKKVLKQCARMCLELDLIAGNVLFVDGTKIRANASACRSHDQGWYEAQLKDIDSRIEQLLQGCEAIDEHEKDLGSLVAMDKELTKSGKLKSAVEAVLSRFKETKSKKINQSDPDCANMRSIHGKHASYNVQCVVDEKIGLIVNAEAVNDATDINQFARQIEQAHEVLQKPCEKACADAGYADTEEFEKIDDKGIDVIVPSQRQALHKGEEPFSKSRFSYDKEQDCYWCPAGQRLNYIGTDRNSGKRHYRIIDRQICHRCEHYGLCTRAKLGRKIIRLAREELKEKLEAKYEQAASQQIYARRKARVEHPFGHIKRNLKTDAFLMRGLQGVGAETSLLATCFNLARMISILGVSGLIGKLSSINAPAVG